LAALVSLPRWAIAACALILIGGHNLFDAAHAQQLGWAHALWVILHEPGRLEPFAGASWFVLYPLIPWVAVMAAGYALGPWALLPRTQRQVRFARLGAALLVGFVLVRAGNLYGDPHPWTAEHGLLRTVLAFLNCEKYPPSMLYLAMTLGPAFCALAWMDRPLGAWAERVSLYGRVPLFYYVLHLALIHAVAIAVAWPELGGAAVTRPFLPSGGLGYSLGTASLIVTLMTSMQVLGMILGGIMGDKTDNSLLATACMGMHATGLLLVAYAFNFPMVIGFAVLHGLAWGIRGPLMQAIRADYFGRSAYGKIMGFSTLVTMLGTIGGPLIAGILADLTGSYEAGFTVLAGMAGLGSIFFILAKKPARPLVDASQREPQPVLSVD